MKLLLLALCTGLVLHASRAADRKPPEPGVEPVTPEPAPAARPIVRIETSMGTLTAELWPDKAPRTVENFLAYVDDEFFDGLIFHRVIKNFMIQGGGFTDDMRQKSTRAAIKNEARADTPNARGTLAMARTMEVDSATSQFFINLVDNDFLNHRGKTPRDFGYCVFGKVIDGMAVVDQIGGTATGQQGPFRDVPREPVRIRSIRRVEQATGAEPDAPPAP